MWLTAGDVAAYMGILVVGDDRIGPATDAARTWVERQRPDLDYTADVPADVHLAGILATALIYQQGLVRLVCHRLRNWGLTTTPALVFR